MLAFLCSVFCLAIPALQEADYEALIDRLRWSDPKDREQAAVKLAAAGSDIVSLLDKALAKAKEHDVIARIEQVRARIRLRLHTPAFGDAFSKPFMRAAPDLIGKLRNPTAEIVLEALEAATGYSGARGPRGFVPVAGTKIEAATQADAILVFRISLSVMPPLESSDEWGPVKAAMSATSHQFKTAALLEDSLIHREHPDPAFRRVVRELSETGHRRRFIPAYLRLLESPHFDVQQQTAWNLRMMSPGEAAPSVAAMIGKTEGHIRASLIECLARSGDPQWKALFLKYAGHEDPQVRGSSVSALALVEPAAAVPHVLKLLESQDSQLLLAGIRAASTQSDPRVWKALENVVFNSPDFMAANQAVYALALCRPENFADIFVKAMRHASHLVRNAAAVNAHWIGGEKIVRGLKALLEDPEPAVSGNAERSLGRLKVEGFEEKKMPVSLLANLDDPSCLPILLDSLEGPNESAAIDGFMKFRFPRVCQDLQELEIAWPKDRNPTVKEALDAVSTALKTKGIALAVKLAPTDERPFIRRNSNRMVVGLAYWLVSVTLSHEYGWYLDDGTLSLVSIDEARRLWREWAASQAKKK
jgi:hypothetical protein